MANFIPNLVSDVVRGSLLIFVVLGTFLLTFHQWSKTQYQFSESLVESSPSISFTTIRQGYSELSYFSASASESVQYSVLLGYGGVIEPNVPMGVTLTYSSDYCLTCSYVYSICSGDSCQSAIYSTDESTVTYITTDCTPFDSLDVVLTEYDAAGSETTSASIQAICMYVRREISALTSDDLADVLDAMHTLYTVSTSEGQELYGTDYYDASYFAKYHHYSSSFRNSDHIHEGIGFMAQHIKITNIFELAMQAVDPSVSLPYWDFTIDVTNGYDIYDSFMFTNMTFGSLNSPSDPITGATYTEDSILLGAIPDGRWAGLLALNASDFDSSFQNAYGYLRSPWNTNPSPYLSRFTTASAALPSCSSYYGELASSDNFTTFLYNIQYGLHGSLHTVVGATFGCDVLDTFRSDGVMTDTQQVTLCLEWSFIMKELFRAGYISRSDSCTYSSLTRDGLDCGFSCTTSSSGDMSLYLEYLLIDYLSSSADSSTYSAFTEFICDGDAHLIFAGDHLESASSYDPSFWPMHPSMERLQHAKLLTLQYTDWEWPSDAQTSYICNKAACYDSSENTTDYFADCCYGHYSEDRIMDFVSQNSTAFIGKSNQYVMTHGDPSSSAYTMPYIYDSFDWTSCDEDFPALIESLSKAQS